MNQDNKRANAATDTSLGSGDKQNIIHLKNIVKVYQIPSGDFPALNSISAAFRKNEYCAIIGKSGAGKSTLVNMMTGVDRVSSGEIIFENTSMHSLGENEMALWRGRKIGVIYQSFLLMPSLSLLDNILLAMEFCGLYRSGLSEQRAMSLLREVELEDHSYKKPSAISGGQQQRAAIARALANDPPVIIADEPTGSLDSSTAEMIYNLFDRLVLEGKTVIVVSHDRSITTRVSHVINLSDGMIVSDYRNTGL